MYVFVDDGESVFWSRSKAKLKEEIKKYYVKERRPNIRFEGESNEESIIDEDVGYEVGFFHEIKKEVK